MNLFVISLKKSVHRRAYMQQQLDAQGVSYEILDAVDGSALCEEELAYHAQTTFPPWSSVNTRHLMPAEVGCILSHLAVYRRMIDEGIDWACVLEDDARLTENLTEVFADLGDCLDRSGVDLLLLGHYGYYHGPSRGVESVPDRDSSAPHERIVRAVEASVGSHAYLIKLSAARTLLEHAYPLRMPMDYLTGHASAIGLRMRVLNPPCAWQAHDAFPSTIVDFDAQLDYFLSYKFLRKTKRSLERHVPVLGKISRLIRHVRFLLPLKLRRAGMLASDSYADRRYFQAKQDVLSATRPAECRASKGKV
jgi:glycosyl transferase family 25